MKYNEVLINSKTILSNIDLFGNVLALTGAWTNNSGEEFYLFYSKKDIEEIIYEILDV